MNKLFLSAVLLCLALPATRALAQDDAARAVVMQAATAMGGIERIRALHGLRLRGYGHEAYQDGGSEVTTEPEAPEKMTNLTAYQREIDLDNGRTLVRARAFRAFVFAAEAMMRGNPLTQVVISHHHFDHTGGLRSAVAEGLTLITQSGNLDWFEKLFARPVTHYPDALSRNPQPVKLLGVDDHLRLSDEALTVDLFRMIANGHMAHGLMAWVPEHKLLIQGDLFDKSWEVYFWGDTYEANVAYRKLDVERDVPVHGSVSTIDEVRATIAEQTRNAAALCARVEEAGLSMPGCPLAWD